jgi:fused signal recognition particle receptor
MAITIFNKIKNGLKKTHDRVTSNLTRIVTGREKPDEEMLEDIEASFIQADIGIEATQRLLDVIRDTYSSEKNVDLPMIKQRIEDELINILGTDNANIKEASQAPTVVLVVGVNGTGKTTTIAKIAKMLKDDGKKVMLAAGDTFRAAAIEQLEIWGERIGIPVIKHQYGADAAAVSFDALEAAEARGVDYLIIDTAGRLHTKVNLMEELKKIQRVLKKKRDEVPHEILLVLDATTGQNAFQQARIFDEAIGITGLVLTKLDGTAKGGIVISIQTQLDIPVKYIGVGEQMDDLQPFIPQDFALALFE